MGFDSTLLSTEAEPVSQPSQTRRYVVHAHTAQHDVSATVDASLTVGVGVGGRFDVDRRDVGGGGQRPRPRAAGPPFAGRGGVAAPRDGVGGQGGWKRGTTD